ncbi:MAG: phenylacetate--CoA ligase family protein [Bacteroidetes bacterium]|nr:phenylacetate--CoA ligase family protein [Bacteroidota bacterium]
MSIGGFIRRNIYWTIDRLKGSPVLQHYKDIKQILKNNDVAKQRKHLQNLLDYSTKYSKFYSAFQGEKLQMFPVMNKELLRKNYDNICVDIVHVPFHQGKMHIQRTSGSTGTPLAIPQDFRKRNRRIAELKYFGNLAGYKSHEKLAQLRIWTKWQSKSKIQTFYENIYAIDCSKIDDKMLLELTQLIKQKRIVALWGYASWYDRLVDFIEKYSIQLFGLKTVIAGSEMLNPATRRKLTKLLNCNVVSRYSNEEQGILGQDRVNDERYYLNHASYYFEFLKLDSNENANPGDLCRIVVTDLFNYAFPMIRYDTGDTGVFIKEKNNSTIILNKIYGRLLDLVFDTNQVAVHPMVLARILKNYDEIELWQFIQKDMDKYELKLKLSTEMDLADCITQLKEIFGQNAQIEVKLIDDIPVLASGKRKPVLNVWKL